MDECGERVRKIKRLKWEMKMVEWRDNRIQY